MAKNWSLAILSLLILANPITCYKNANRTHVKTNNSNNTLNLNERSNNRLKRSLHAETEKVFMPLNTKLFDFEIEDKDRKINYDLEQPFWGTRGRRDSSEENLNDVDNTNSNAHDITSKNCKNCFKTFLNNFDSATEPISPFWGNRGRRNSDEVEDYSGRYNSLWGNRDRRQEEEPFWGTRGRREQQSPFLDGRDINEGILVKNEKYFSVPTSNNRYRPDTLSRNRRSRSAKGYLQRQALLDENEPFWGNRGRRETVEPFWGSRGRRKDSSEAYEGYEPFWGSRGRRKAALTYTIMKTMNRIQRDIENLSRLRRSHDIVKPYWSNTGQESEMPTSTNDLASGLGSGSRNKESTANFQLNFKPSESETVLDDRIYAEQPRFILVERSSRSSAEDDPFFISRGKKFMNKSFEESTRGRRGAIEELVKSVRSDPYYIARGKKDAEGVKFGNSTISKEEIEKAVDLICSTLNLLTIKGEEDKVKREINDNERDRRTILKNLAAQLQADPYFVSRGKKSEISGTRGENLEAFIKEVAAMCD